jgi:nucleoside-diphosphate-sugar epimerase
MKNILVTGAFGQIGSELVPTLQEKYGVSNVVAMGHSNYPKDYKGPFVAGEITDKTFLEEIIGKYQIDTVFHLAAYLSVKSEMDPQGAWKVNVIGLKNVLDLSAKHKLKMFWPSSIAVFGPTTPRKNTPQITPIEPTTMYGVGKLTGESLCHYYFLKYGLDVRSVRYPGLLDYKTPPSLGTTEYAKEIFWKAIQEKKYTVPLKEDTTMPMMFMLDAIRATISIMEAPTENIKVRTSYNLAAFSFSPKELYQEIKNSIPELEIEYKETEIQKIADSWPQSIDDSMARAHWGWQPKYSFQELVRQMYQNIKKQIENGRK